LKEFDDAIYLIFAEFEAMGYGKGSAMANAIMEAAIPYYQQGGASADYVIEKIEALKDKPGILGIPFSTNYESVLSGEIVSPDRWRKNGSSEAVVCVNHFITQKTSVITEFIAICIIMFVAQNIQRGPFIIFTTPNE
jgi:hypothetical protein